MQDSRSWFRSSCWRGLYHAQPHVGGCRGHYWNDGSCVRVRSLVPRHSECVTHFLFFPAARSTGSAKLDGAVTYIDELEVVDLSKCIYPSASHYLARGKISCTFAFFSKSLRIHSKAGAVTSKANRNEDIRWID